MMGVNDVLHGPAPVGRHRSRAGSTAAAHRQPRGQLRGALEKVFHQVAQLQQWGWPCSWVEYEQHACRTVADAGAYLRTNPHPDLDDLLQIAQPIIDAYWPGDMPTMKETHEAVQKLRRTAAAVRYDHRTAELAATYAAAAPPPLYRAA
jgi:hypothetical protein